MSEKERRRFMRDDEKKCVDFAEFCLHNVIKKHYNKKEQVQNLYEIYQTTKYMSIEDLWWYYKKNIH